MPKESEPMRLSVEGKSETISNETNEATNLSTERRNLGKQDLERNLSLPPHVDFFLFPSPSLSLAFSLSLWRTLLLPLGLPRSLFLFSSLSLVETKRLLR